MTTTERGARVRAVQAAAGAAALLTLPAGVAAGNVAEGERDEGASRLAGEIHSPPSPRQTALRAPIAGHVTVAGQMRAARRADEQQRLVRVATRLRARVAHARRERPDRASLRGEAPAALRVRVTRLRRELRAARRARTVSPARRDAPSSRSPSATVHPALQAIAACESGGDPGAIGGGGLYRGKYQFSYETWGAVGGSGDPAAASEAEQDMRAARLYARSGATSWPVCGR